MSYFNEKNIVSEKSVFYAQDQNEIAKCSICTIIQKTCTMLINAKLLAKFWLNALFMVCYITNRLLTKTLQGKTLFEV